MKSTFTIINSMICLLLILSFSLSGCKSDKNNDPEIYYPTEEEKSPFILNNMLGSFLYNEEIKEWVIIPEREQDNLFINLGDEEGMYMIVSNMSDEYKKYKETVEFSGEAKLSHHIIYNKDMGVKTYVYTIKLSSVFASE